MYVDIDSRCHRWNLIRFYSSLFLDTHHHQREIYLFWLKRFLIIYESLCVAATLAVVYLLPSTPHHQTTNSHMSLKYWKFLIIANNTGESIEVDRNAASTLLSSSTDVSKTQSFLDRKIKTFLAVTTHKDLTTISWKKTFFRFSVMSVWEMDFLSRNFPSNRMFIGTQLRQWWQKPCSLINENDKFIQAICVASIESSEHSCQHSLP